MTNHSNTEVDIKKFISEYHKEKGEVNAQVCKRLRDLHKVYDEIQGYATLILERTSDDNRYLSFKYIAGMAVALSKQSDWLIDDFICYGKRATAFWSMMQFEQDLRKAENGQISADEKKSINNRLRQYLKSDMHITEACNQGGRVATSVLYPMMAIMHNYKLKSKSNPDFEAMLTDFYKLNLDIDVSPIIKNLEEATKDVFGEKTEKDKIDIDVLKPIEIKTSYVTEAEDVAIQTKLEDGFDNQPNILQPEIIDNQPSVLQIESEKASAKNEQLAKETAEELKKRLNTAEMQRRIKELAKNQDIANSSEFLEYATQHFFSEKDFANVPLDNFFYTVTRKIMGQVCDESEVKPFLNVSSAEEVKNIFNSLDNGLQKAFIQNIYQESAFGSLLNDVDNFKNIDKTQQEQIAKICKHDIVLNVKVGKKQKELQKEKNKDIRRMVRFAKKYADNKSNPIM